MVAKFNNVYREEGLIFLLPTIILELEANYWEAGICWGPFALSILQKLPQTSNK